jgi:hypothetical protein
MKALDPLAQWVEHGIAPGPANGVQSDGWGDDLYRPNLPLSGITAV